MALPCGTGRRTASGTSASSAASYHRSPRCSVTVAASAAPITPVERVKDAPATIPRARTTATTRKPAAPAASPKLHRASMLAPPRNAIAPVARPKPGAARRAASRLTDGEHGDRAARATHAAEPQGIERDPLRRHAADERDEDPARGDAEAQAEHQARLAGRPEGEIHQRSDKRRRSREQEQLFLEFELAGQVDRDKEAGRGREAAHAHGIENERRGDPGDERPDAPLDPGVSEKFLHCLNRARPGSRP